MNYCKESNVLHTTPEQRVISVDYNRNLEQMIALGNYDERSKDITGEAFPLIGRETGVVQYETKLFHFGQHMLEFVAIEKIENADQDFPWEPAGIEHLLSFGATHPQEQCKCLIAALGSINHNKERKDFYKAILEPSIHPVLDTCAGKRRLTGHWFMDWEGGCHFLAVRPIAEGVLLPVLDLTRSLSVFDVWGMIEVGGISKDEWLVRLKNVGIDLGSWWKNRGFDSWQPKSQKQVANLARCKIRDLGFVRKPTTTKVWRRIQEVGNLCPIEIELNFLLQCDTKLGGNSFYLATEQTTGLSDEPNFIQFFISPDGTVCGGGPHAERGCWNLEDEVVFIVKPT